MLTLYALAFGAAVGVIVWIIATEYDRRHAARRQQEQTLDLTERLDLPTPTPPVPADRRPGT